MTDPRLPEPVEKSDNGYRHVQDRCVKLRRSGRLPYHWIADMSRRGYFVRTFSGQPSSLPNPLSSSSEYFVIRRNHCVRSRISTMVSS